MDVNATVHHAVSRVSTTATVALVMVIIIAVLLIVLGVWFFVERNQFLYPRYNVQTLQLTGTTGNSIQLKNGAGDTVLVFNQSSANTATALNITVSASTSNNVKGQFFYIQYPFYSDTGTANSPTVTVTMSAQSPVSFDTTTFKLSPGTTGIYFLDNTDQKFKFMGTTRQQVTS